MAKYIKGGTYTRTYALTIDPMTVASSGTIDVDSASGCTWAPRQAPLSAPPVKLIESL